MLLESVVYGITKRYHRYTKYCQLESVMYTLPADNSQILPRAIAVPVMWKAYVVRAGRLTRENQYYFCKPPLARIIRLS